MPGELFLALLIFPASIWSFLSALLDLAMLAEVLQVLRGAGKVGSALVATQGEQLRLVACTSTIGAGVKVAQEAVEGLMGSFMASSMVRMV